MMIRATLIISGDVQEAGYRDIVEDIAVKLGVKGFVESLRDKTVCVVCEAEKDVVDRFVDAIKIKNDIVDVKYGGHEEELGEYFGWFYKVMRGELHG